MGATGHGGQPWGCFCPRPRSRPRTAAAELVVFSGRREGAFLVLKAPFVALSPSPGLILNVCSQQQEILVKPHKDIGELNSVQQRQREALF